MYQCYCVQVVINVPVTGVYIPRHSYRRCLYTCQHAHCVCVGIPVWRFVDVYISIVLTLWVFIYHSMHSLPWTFIYVRAFAPWVFIYLSVRCVCRCLYSCQCVESVGVYILVSTFNPWGFIYLSVSSLCRCLCTRQCITLQALFFPAACASSRSL